MEFSTRFKHNIGERVRYVEDTESKVTYIIIRKGLLNSETPVYSLRSEVDGTEVRHVPESEIVRIYGDEYRGTLEELIEEVASFDHDDELCPIEVNWLETTDEWVINIGDIIIVDGLASEQEAEVLRDSFYKEEL